MFYRNSNDDRTKYKIGLYIRLSREDGDDLESESITNQRSLLIGYLKVNNLNFEEEYIDDGFSGGNFNRPGFQRLMDDIEHKKINCVITKDLSRLGRDHVETGRLIERYFPENNIRYIAVIDDFDTFNETSSSDMIPFKLSMNDMYAKDISKKVRASLYTKMRNHEYCGSTAPYGYEKDKNDKHILRPSKEYAPVVKKIFELYIAGYSACTIANLLTIEGVKTPIQVKNEGKELDERKHPEIWRHSSVAMILKNRIYTGCLVQHKFQNVSYKSKKRRILPESEWIICEGAHEAIIDKETYLLAQKIKSKNNTYTEDRRNVKYNLSNLVYCKDCGSLMSISYDKKRDRITMNCNSYKKFSKYGMCFSHYINYTKLEKTIYSRIRENSLLYLKDKDEFMNLLKKESFNPLSDIENKIKKCKHTIESLKKKQDSLYDDKFNGIINNEVYSRLFTKTNLEIEDNEKKLNKYIAELDSHNIKKIDDNNYEKIIKDFLNISNPTKEMLNKIIDKVYITKDKEVEIIYRIGSKNKVTV